MPTFPGRWPVKHPDRIQLYSMPTPNGKKASIALEELGLEYEAHWVDIMKGDQHDPDFIRINSNSKVPAIIDPNGPDGEPLRIMESGAILHYLARKGGQLLPSDPRGENEVLQWVFFQVGSIGPMFGQFGHFRKFAKGKTDAYGEQRYQREVVRLLGVLESRLEQRDWLCGDFSIADIATAPWMRSLEFYDAYDAVGFENFPRVNEWANRFEARPAVQRGSQVPTPPGGNS